ncbi:MULTISPECIES: ABC transporter substrate-binding protein [unclassified Fusibacter]|uniref:ABC transporter substrate-binding protein n=1 Tax=unclassified Fusibacter TaxID=2624464 RepID=UPI00101294CD|nr:MULTISPECIES: ABC transporter substrate-binding protein [unclassified Fusibacter]MCK8058381.1 ABC transporter substrate-binding protein [Fusibacter sp. A2]NPE20964.1 hypothetical protein [Fusibacter sp. A1]RXV63166.1 hypothetical protein DWB64_03940 [Fusibacter sp. A1]
MKSKSLVITLLLITAIIVATGVLYNAVKPSATAEAKTTIPDSTKIDNCATKYPEKTTPKVPKTVDMTIEGTLVRVFTKSGDLLGQLDFASVSDELVVNFTKNVTGKPHVLVVCATSSDKRPRAIYRYDYLTASAEKIYQVKLDNELIDSIEIAGGTIEILHGHINEYGYNYTRNDGDLDVFLKATDLLEGEIDGFELIKNKKARQAIAMAMDKQVFVDEMSYCLETETQLFNKNAIVDLNGKPVSSYVTGDTGGIDYDPDMALKLWNEVKQELDFNTVTLRIYRWGSLMESQLDSLIFDIENTLPGLNINIYTTKMSSGLWIRPLNSYHLSSSSVHTDYQDSKVTASDDFNGVARRPEEYSLMIERINSATTFDEWVNSIITLEKTILDEALIIPLSNYADYYLIRSNLKNVGVIDGIYSNSAMNLSFTNTSFIKDANQNEVYLKGHYYYEESLWSIIRSSSDFVRFHLYEGLMKIDMNNKVVPGMAKDYTVSEDGLTYVFTLDGEKKWSNGEPVTAYDFENTWKDTLKANTLNSNEYNLLYAMESAGVKNAKEIRENNADPNLIGFKALNDTQLQIELESPNVMFLRLLSKPSFVALYDNSLHTDKRATDEIITNGAYRITEKTEDRIVLERNQNYYDNHFDYIPQIILDNRLPDEREANPIRYDAEMLSLHQNSPHLNEDGTLKVPSDRRLLAVPENTNIYYTFMEE